MPTNYDLKFIAAGSPFLGGSFLFGALGGAADLSPEPILGSTVAAYISTLLGFSDPDTGQLAATRGGTGIGTYAVGDLLYASTASVLSKLADVATGNALISGGVGVAPAWGKIGITTHIATTTADRLFGSSGAGASALITLPAAGLALSSSAVVLTNDLAALEGLGSTGFAVRSASDTWVQRLLAGTAAEITVTNGDGVSGNPTLSLPTALTFTGKTVTGGTFASPTAITGLPDPTGAQDAATKAYVDSVSAGLDVKASVKCRTTANITLSGEQTLDGILTSASRVLVANQTAPAENGVYLSAAGAWSRVTDMDAWAEVPGSFVFVEQGTTYADTAWVCTADAGGTLGTTAITWSQFAGAGTYTATGGVTLTGTQFSITTNGITNAMLRQSAAVSLVGRSANSTGDVADIAAGANDRLLTRVSDALAFTQLTVGMLPNDVVTYAKIQNVSATDRLLGRDTAAAGDIEELTVGNGLEFTGGPGIGIANNGVTYARIQDISVTQRVLGRNTAGAGDTEEVTATQVLDWLGATQGQILYRGASGWAALGVGTAGQVLSTNGAAANPSWIAAGGTGTVTSVTPGGGLTSILTATAPGSAITTTGTLYGAMLVNAQTGTTYTFLDGDRAKYVTFSNVASVAATLPQAGAASAFQSGWFCDVRNNNYGAVTITPTTSTINGAATLVLQRGQGGRITTDGTNYFFLGGFGPKVVIQVFTASGTYTPTAGMTYCIIEALGGGAGGGGADSDATNTGCGGGGGSGSYARKTASAADIGASQTVTIGAGGAGGSSGLNNGSAGSDTSVGSLCIGKGGSPGLAGNGTTNGPGEGGAGGVAGTGDFTPAGNPGGTGLASAVTTNTFASGAGGASIFGGAGNGVTPINNGVNASNYGSGGSGGNSYAGATQSGGNGSAGVVIVTEFLA